MKVEKISRNQVINNSFWKFLESFGIQIIQLLVTIVLARILGPDEYGLMAIVLVTVNFLGIFINSSISSYLVYISDIRKQSFFTSLVVNVFVSIILSLMLIISSGMIADFYNQPTLAPLIRVMAIVLPLNAISAVYNAYAQKMSLFRKLFVRNMIALPTSGALALMAASLGFGVWSLVIQQVSYSFLLCVIVILTIKINIEGEWKLEKRMIVPMFSYGGMNLTSSLIAFFSDNICDLLIGKRINSQQLGYYNRGNHFPGSILNVINSVVAGVLFPAFASYQSDIKLLKDKIRKSIRLAYYITIPLLFGMIVVAKPLVFALLSEKWEQSIIIIQLICLFYLATPFLQIGSQLMLAVGKLHFRIFGETLKMLLTLSFLMLIIDNGIIAVSISRVLVNSILVIVGLFFNKLILGYSLSEFLRDMSIPVLLGVILMLVVYPLIYLPIPYWMILTIQIPVGAFTYYFSAKILRVDELNDIIHLIENKIKFH